VAEAWSYYWPDSRLDTHTVTRYAYAANFKHLNGTQITESESHPGWDRNHKKRFRGDLGGPFRTEKKWAVGSSNQPALFRRSDDSTAKRTYVNRNLCIALPIAPLYLSLPSSIASSNSALDKLGTVAIARCSPSNPSADLSSLIGETIKDGIPAVTGSLLKQWKGLSNRDRRKAIGGEYLNVEFGWKPLVNDLRKVAKSILDADKILKDYQRGSGKLVRRKYDFPPVSTTTSQIMASGTNPYFVPTTGTFVDPPIHTGRVILVQKDEKRQWFRGAFTYYVPPSNTLRNSIARHVIQARKLLGISLTPDTLWNLAPWSWAVDWFTDTSGVLSNWTDWAIDNQVLAYGYMMEHSLRSWTITYEGPTGFTPPDVRPGVLASYCETKIRRKATPYGFGIDSSALSARQLAIVAALGLNKS